MLPTIRRTWGLRGQPPILKHALRHHRKVSGIGALTISPQRRRLGAYLKPVYDGNVEQPTVVDFLRDLRRHLAPRITVLWDRWPVHRGATVRAFLARQCRIRLEWLPPYAPELNPQDWLWADLKGHRLCNHGLTALPILARGLRREFQDLRTDQGLLRSFVRATKLPFRLPRPGHWQYFTQ